MVFRLVFISLASPFLSAASPVGKLKAEGRGEAWINLSTKIRNYKFSLLFLCNFLPLEDPLDYQPFSVS